MGVLKEFFAHSRTERTGIIILLIILLSTIVIPSLLPDKKTDTADLEDLKTRVAEFEQKLNKQLDKEKPQLFVFDPNTADSLDFCKLGFSSAQTAVILRYRNRGGKFGSADDFGQIYVVSDSVFSSLKPYIQIAKPKIKVIELNSANISDLIELQGIGEYYAKKIIERRNKLGGFSSTNQLLEIYNLDEERLSLFRKQIRIDTLLIQKINLNTVIASELRKHPYFDNEVVSKIIKLRKLKNKISSLNQLINENIVTDEQARKIKVYVVFD